MHLEPGTVLADRFEIRGAPLGAGASGVVYPARDLATGTDVAAKVLHAELAGDPRALARLQDEACTVGRLKHPHVVEVHGLWSAGSGRWVLVTEQVDGVPLSGLGAGMAPEAVVALGLQITQALTASHAVGIVHGDVRPGNVLLGATGARLFDFGLARLAAARVSPGERAVLRAGTTAPEVLDGGPARLPADLYGLGIILYTALTGEEPYLGSTPWARMGLQRQGPPPLVGPRGLVTVIRALLQPDPTARPRDLAAVRTALLGLRKNPRRSVSMRRWRPPPMRPGRAWIVHGIDPLTRGGAVAGTGLSRRAARRLERHLTAEGWEVRADREALGTRDLAWIAAVTCFGALFLPFIGFVPAMWLALRWRGRGLRPDLRRALPPMTAPIPPRVLPMGNETTVMVGMLLLITALSLVFSPFVAVLPAALVLAVMVFGSRSTRSDPAQIARRGHVNAALADLRAGISARRLPLDEALGLSGEIDSLEAAWRIGDLDADALLVRVDGLAAEVTRRPPVALGHPAIQALRGLTER